VDRHASDPKFVESYKNKGARVKVFVNWSGELSHNVARVFAQMLPVLLALT